MSSCRDNATHFRNRSSRQVSSKLPLDDTPDTNNKKIIAGFEVQSRLGSGSFASVYKAVKKLEDGRSAIVAIKAISRKGKRLTPKILENLELEIAILKTYRHRNIVVLHNVQKTDRHFYLLLEFCGGGDLQQLIRTRKKKRLSEGLSRRLMRDLTSGLKFLWGQSIIHRDIKPQNLLLSGQLPLDELYDECEKESDEKERQKANFPSSQFALKIADFGFARPLENTSLAETLCGSPLYMAPEILEGLKYDAKADLWSVGTVLFEMVTGRPPFIGDNHIHLLRNIKTKSLRMPEGVKVSQECVDLLKLLLNRNPTKRADFNSFSQSSDKFVALGCAGAPIAEESNTWPERDIGRMAPVVESSSSRESMEDIQNQNNVKALNSHAHPLHSPVRIPDDNQISVTPPAPPAPFTLRANTSAVICSKKPPSYQSNERHKSYRNFAPLHPSPPGSVAMKKVEISKSPSSPPFVLDSSESTRSFLQVANIPPPPPLFQREKTVRTCHAPSHQCLHSHLKADSSTSDSEFVMVEHGSTNVSSSVSSQVKNGEQLVHVRQRNPSAINNPRVSSFSDITVRGILDTNPETGRVLLAMMASHSFQTQTTSAMNSLHTFSRIQCMRNASLNSSSDVELAAKMLAVAEDIGRRAVNVAHLGDTRAYLAMRKADSYVEGSSLTGFVPMEDDEMTNEKLGRNGINNCMSIRPLACSSDKNEDKIEVDDDDEEMPFAINNTPLNMPDLVKPAHSSDRKSGLGYNSFTASKKNDHANLWQPLICYQEALSCYVKAMSLMKCAVHAIQMIMEKIGMHDSNSIVRCANNEKLLLMQRCQTSFQWLGGQFTGVLERANAANTEIGKSSSNTLVHGSVSTPQRKIGVEELIYNHALACGRDGAVKQLLGHYDAARTFYRSAGILLETLLMEHRVVGEDRKILLEYIEGFSERIRELNSTSLSKRGSRRGSSVVGGVIPFQGHGMERIVPDSQKSIQFSSEPMGLE